MLDLEKDLQWSPAGACDSAPQPASTDKPLDLEAYLDFLDDIDAFTSSAAKRKKEPFFFREAFVL